MSDQGSTPPPQDPDQPGGTPGGYGPPPSQPPYGSPPPGYGQAPPPGYGQAPGQGYGQAPGQGYGQPMGSPPPNYLVWAILSTLFCCLPLGVASIVFAAQVNGKHAAGDVRGAQESSEKAKKFAIWSAVAGLIVGVLYVLLFVAVGVGSDT